MLKIQCEGLYREGMKTGQGNSQATMRAVIVRAFGGPEVMHVEEVGILVPGPDQVLVRVHAAGVNPVDTYIRDGKYGKLPTLPFTPGMDGAGIVESSSVDRFKPGMRVYVGRSISGTYAQFALCDSSQVHVLPDRLSFSQGAGVHVPYWTAMHAMVQKARVQRGEWMLVHGASGGVGLAAIQIGRMFGLRMIGTAGSAEGLDLVRAQGAEHALNHHESGYLDVIRSLTGYPVGGVHVVLEMLANVNLEKDFGVLAMGARVIVIGNRGRIEINPRDLMSRDASVLGMSLLNTSMEEQARLSRLVGEGLDSGDLAPFVRCELPLHRSTEAHETLRKSGAGGKIVLLPWDR